MMVWHIVWHYYLYFPHIPYLLYFYIPEMVSISVWFDNICIEEPNIVGFRSYSLYLMTEIEPISNT
jgi:hypothetical protein